MLARIETVNRVVNLAVCVIGAALGQNVGVRDRQINPFEVYDRALQAGAGEGIRSLRMALDRLLTAERNKLGATQMCSTASDCLLIAEMMKRLGDLRAPRFYEAAIAADPREPAYELFYADYWRNYRGPRAPVFPSAERHYVAAARKLESIPAALERDWDGETTSRLRRGFIALHERDGLPLVPGAQSDSSTGGRWKDPLVFLSSVNRVSAGGAELDRLSDIRDYTSEAMETLSRLPPGTILDRDVLRGLLRPKRTIETYNRLRLRYREAPVIDINYTLHDAKQAQLTNFRNPTIFNDVRLRSIAMTAEKPFAWGTVFDGSVAFAFARTRRRGLIEYAASAYERVEQFEGRAVFSRFIGPDKLSFETLIARHNIRADGDPNRTRPRSFNGAVVTYQIFRPVGLLRRSLTTTFSRRFDLRGIDLYAGGLNDAETFLGSPGASDIELIRRDRFVGLSVRGVSRFDFSIQPTFLSSRSKLKPGVDNSQYRTYGSVLVRLRDEERTPGLPDGKSALRVAFVHLVFPVRHDIARDGLPGFGNYQIGAQLSAKLFHTGSVGTSWLASLRYDYQRFPKLGRTLNSITLSMGMGF